MSSSNPADPSNPLVLTTPYFKLGVDTLIMLRGCEKHAIEAVHAYAGSLAQPGIQLVDNAGRPIKSVAERLQTEMTAYLLHTLELPTLDEEWVITPTAAGKIGSITGYSFRVAYLVYQEFARVLHLRGCAMFTSIPDVILIQALNALHHELDPVSAFVRVIKPQAQVDADGVHILGQEAVFHEHLKRAYLAFIIWMDTKGLLIDPSTPVDLPTLSLPAVRLLKHLIAVLGYSESSKAQAPALVEELRLSQAQGETRTIRQVSDDISEAERRFNNPNTKLPEA